MDTLDKALNNAAPEHGDGFNWSPMRVTVIVLVLGAVLGLTTFMVHAGDPLSIEGYADFSYGNTITAEPTGKESESKAWWNDQYWWAILYNNDAGAYHIYRLEAATQDWIDTGVAVDDRPSSRADVLWDEDAQKLYVASHRKMENPSKNTNPDNWAELYRYSYDAASDSYSLDDSFPVTINESVTESVVLDKDSQGRLWITYVTREAGTSVYEVYVNHTTDVNDDTSWATPYPLPFDEATVDMDDISALVAFEDDEGAKVGVMWSNQITEPVNYDGFYFAVRSDVAEPGSGNWTLDSDFTTAITAKADDHINFATLPTGELLAVIKTGADPQAEPLETLIGVVTRESDGTYGFVEVSPASSLDTSPIILANADGNEVYVFTSTKTDGGSICQHTATVTAPLSNMDFDGDNCPPAGGEPEGSLAALFALQDAPVFIADGETYFYIDNPTSTKQMVNDDSGIMVLASDEPQRYYVHNHVGGTVPPTPTPGATQTATPTPTPDPTGTPDPTPDPGVSEELYLPTILKDVNTGGQ